jgi:hypothetical protein
VTRYTICPDCKLKGVYLKLSNRPGGDVYKCRIKKCDFYFYADISDPWDKEAHDRWCKINEVKE